MNSAIVKGAALHGFEILEVMDMPEFEAQGIYARHLQSRAEVFHLLTKDTENLFAFAFATAAADSTGVAHILEHSVLCGSERYPIKDPFMVLAQGSLQTYLNAWTFPDKTVYPASSVHEADYFNLMSVYGDAVFFPKLEEWTFRQEGYRLQFNRRPADRSLDITGVVYNEMKGAYSALDEYAQRWSVASALPDTIYAFDSGGDPEHIPELSYQKFVDFHRLKYAPANCRIFLAGNISTEKQLSFLNNQFLSRLPAGERAPAVALAARWDAPKSYTVDAPPDPDNKASVFISWHCGVDIQHTPEALIEWYALTETLLGHDGAPLLRALLESHMGDDLATVTGVDTEIREPLWVAGLRGVPLETPAPAVEELIMGELYKLSHKGIPREAVEAALLALEFSNREIKRPGGPWSLALLRKSLRGWMHGCVPWATMCFNEPFTRLKQRIAEDGRYLETLIEKALLNNPHRALVSIRPDKGFLAAQQQKLAQKLEHIELSLSRAERAALEKQNRALERKQSAKDSPAVLQKIPHISVAALDKTLETVPRRLLNAGALPVLSTPAWTNGICYCDFAVPVDVLAPEDYLYLPIFCQCVTALGTPDMDYAEVSSLLARTTGDFYAAPFAGISAGLMENPVETPAGSFDLIGRDWILFRLKCLDKKTDEAVELALRVIREADFSDHRRLRDLVFEFKNNAEDSLAPMGSVFAASRAMTRANLTKVKTEVLSGLTQLEFARRIAREPLEKTAARLTRLRDTLFTKAGMIAHSTGEAEDRILRALERNAAVFGPPACRNPETGDTERFLALTAFQGNIPHEAAFEVFASPSLQVGFAAAFWEASPYVADNSVYEQMLAHHLSTTVLWETVRMKGGAYGARASVEPVERCFTFSSYRDPNPARTVSLFSQILAQAARRGNSASEIEKAVIGVYTKLKQPQTNAQKGALDFTRFLYGIPHTAREQRLACLLAAHKKVMNEAARALGERAPKPRGVIICGAKEAREAAKRYDAPLIELGV